MANGFKSFGAAPARPRRRRAPAIAHLRCLAAILAVSAPPLAATAASQAAEPVEILAALYAAHPHRQQPPGGMEAWSAAMRALWAEELARPPTQSRLSFDFMTASQDGRFRGLSVVPGPKGAGVPAVLATFDNGWGAPITLEYCFENSAGGWRIGDVANKSDDGGWRLSDILAGRK